MWGLFLPPTAEHHGSLKGSGPPLRSVWTGPVSQPLSDEQQRVFPVVHLSLEELVLLMRQLDAQQGAPICGGQVLLHTDLPASCATTLSWPRPIQQLRCGFLCSCDSHLGDLEDKLSGSWDLGGGVSLSVVARGSQGESGLRAGRVRVVLIDALPCMLVRIKGEVSGEEEDVGAGFAALADPAAGQRPRRCRAVGQHWGALLCGAVHKGAHRAGVDVMLHRLERWEMIIIFISNYWI